MEGSSMQREANYILIFANTHAAFLIFSLTAKYSFEERVKKTYLLTHSAMSALLYAWQKELYFYITFKSKLFSSSVNGNIIFSAQNFTLPQFQIAMITKRF